MKKRYIPQLDMELSPLGFGIMRLPMDGDNFPEEVYDLLDKAMEKGINYYDTAYPYQKGKSELLVREALVKRYERNRFYIADKLPVWECKSQEDMEKIFQIQMNRLGAEWIDFYLLHGLHKNTWENVYEKRVLDFLERKRKEGKIHKIGFSFHDTTEVLKQIEKTYDWDFIQLQINYYDWEAIRIKKSYEYLVKQNIPCMVMEPVGGGRLSHLPKEAETILKNIHPERSCASWAIQYAANLSQVAVTLSGINDETQLNDNCAQFCPIQPMNEEEKAAIQKVVKIIDSYHAIPCSGCRYCMDDCPKGVDIPQIFKRYNDFCLFEGMADFDVDYFAFVPEGKRGDSCINCQRCVKKCPQKINIPQEIKKIHQFAVSSGLGIEQNQFRDFIEQNKKKKIICFGAGVKGIRAKNFLQHEGIQVIYFCDNAENKWGSIVDGIEVISPAKLTELYKKEELCILITNAYKKEIQEQLKKMNISYE